MKAKPISVLAAILSLVLGPPSVSSIPDTLDAIKMMKALNRNL